MIITDRVSPSDFPFNIMPCSAERQQGADLSFSSVITEMAAKKSGGPVKTNEESEPTYCLSESQAEYLSEKYDLDNMPQYSVQEREFLSELVSMNVISKRDAEMFNFNCGGTVESVTSYVSVIPLDENDPYAMPAPMWEDRYNDYDNIIDRLMAIIETQNNISKYYADKCCDIENAEKCDLDGLSASREWLLAKQKILSVLQSISES